MRRIWYLEWMHLHFSARPLTFGFFILGCIAGGFLCLVLVWWDTLHLQLLKAKAMSESGSFASEASQFKCTDISNMWWQSNTNGNKSQSVKWTHTGKQQKLTHAFFSQDSCWKHVKGLCHFIPSSSSSQVVRPGCTCPVSDSLPLGGWVPWVPGWAPEWPAIGIGDAADSDLVLALWPLANHGGRNLANIWWCYFCDHTDLLAWHTLTILDIWIWSHFPCSLNQNRVGASSFRCLTSSDSAGSSFPWHNGTVAMDFRISHAHNGTPSFKKQKRFAGLRLWKNNGPSLSST